LKPNLGWAIGWALAMSTLAACSIPAEPPPPTPNRYGAPVVAAPRDVTPYTSAPCDGPLNGDTLRELGFSNPGRPTRLTTGVDSCTWEDYRTEQAVSLGVYPTRDILVDTYRTRLFPIFTPIRVQELPAVEEQSSSSATACTITVATAENQGFVVTYTRLEVAAGEHPDDPCGSGRRVAERVAASLTPIPAK
jgi:hypothetical protein